MAVSANGFFVPGYTMVDRSYWLCPMVVPNREFFKQFAEAQGIFVYIKSTQVSAIEMPKEKLALGLKQPENVHKFLKNVVYMPVTSITPKKANEINI